MKHIFKIINVKTYIKYSCYISIKNLITNTIIKKHNDILKSLTKKLDKNLLLQHLSAAKNFHLYLYPSSTGNTG